MAFTGRNLPIFEYATNTLQAVGSPWKETSIVRCKMPLKFKLEHRTPSYLSISRRRKRDLKHTISDIYRDSASLPIINLLHEKSPEFGNREPFRQVYDSSDTRARGWEEELRRDQPGIADGIGSTYFSEKSLAAERQTSEGSTKPSEDLEKENFHDEVNMENSTREKGGGTIGTKGKGTERNVEVEVKAVSWRERYIRANICVEASYGAMWEVLTDYERLAEFIPNLVRSETIASPNPGGIWLLQQGVQSATYWHIEAFVVLDVEELPHAVDGNELRFFMVYGDFKCYNGRWYLRPGPRFGTTMLHYEVNVTPKLFFPALFLERIIQADLPVNLCALAQRAETDPSEWKKIVQPSKLLFDRRAPSLIPAFVNKSSSLRSSQTSQLDRPCSVDEVHLRRLDDLLENGGVHRHVVAAITVESPIEDVWDVLTDYDSLSEFIPNLASSKIVSREDNQVRIVQEGYKRMSHMVLHARVVLELWEKPKNEIIFFQVDGDFESFRGKWTLEPLGSDHTLVKYVVDIKMHKHCLLAEAIVEEVIYVDLPSNLRTIRDRVELRKGNSLHVKAPSVQEVLKESGEGKTTLESGSKTSRLPPKFQGKRSRVVGLQKDFRVLEKELLAFILAHGREGYMPMRSELRHHKRVDLEKAIARVGGFSMVATRLNLCQRRRPRGFWDDFQNLCHEIWRFQKETGMDRTYMPTRNSLKQAGRPDVARALEKWGGLHEVARLMGLKVRRARLGYSAKLRYSNPSSLGENDSIAQKPFKISLPEKPMKWVDLKQEQSHKDK